ncbi:dTMP kinase [Streptomyces sp. NBC_01618]|uniref:dTMP kinase n=1 Tax=Streptomyces sp. NBC_01618 TaxID=2975900 RepID=UPI003865896D|nr:thymidylate kinase [Streptomyces sp. NBC_01618]
MSLPVTYEPRIYDGSEEPFIVLEGVSGIGKSTIARLLTHRLRATSLHTLPKPHNDWSKPVNNRLASLPQIAFYLSGLMHASDCVRSSRVASPVIADRYQASVIACHAAVRGIPIDHVRQIAEPFLSYLVQPTVTFYLRCSEETLRARMNTKGDLKQDDTELFSVPGRLRQLLFNFETVAADDPSAVWVDTEGKTPDQLVHEITQTLERTRA